MDGSIAVTLGAGSGIDTRALVSSLIDAQFAAKTQALTARKEALTAQISALSQFRSGLTGFSTALTSLVSGGSLSTQPVSSDASVLGVALLPGANISGTNASVEVRQLAMAQVATSGLVADKAAAFGKGTLTITLGSATYDSNNVPTGFTPKTGATPVTVTIGDGENSLSGIASAINAANSGVTASVVSDVSGSRLVLKGATGAEQAFQIDVAEDAAAPGLSALAFNAGAQGLSLTRASQDARVAVDGVEVRRPTNSVSDLLPGVRLDLVKAAPGTSVTIGTSAPTSALSQAMTDIVETYNQLINLAKAETNSASGPLRGDPGAREFMRQLGTLTNRALVENAPDGTPSRLAEIGVQTNRDGTLTLNTGSLQTALTRSGPAVERMITQGLGSALRQISLAMTAPTGPLASSQSGYTRLQSALAKEEEKIALETENMRTRLTRQFAGMDARVSAYKATQSFLDQQIKSWTNNA